MTLHHIEAVQVLPVTVEEAWAFFIDPRNLARITPSDSVALPTASGPDERLSERPTESGSA